MNNTFIFWFVSIIIILLSHQSNSYIPNGTEIKEILRVHNAFRATVSPPSNAMFKLVWNEEGAERAELMAKKCIFDHDSSSDRATKSYPTGGGQNLFATNAPWIVSWTYVLNSWHEEVDLFEFGKDSENFYDVGHYTQMVWGSTKEVGCARYDCPNLKIYTCNYYPGGNSVPYYVPYQRAENQSCSGCLKNSSCEESGPFAGKLLTNCSLFCENQYANCDSLAQNKFCPFLSESCPLSCLKECQSIPLNNTIQK